MNDGRIFCKQCGALYEPEQEREHWSCRLSVKLFAAQKRIAELEAENAQLRAKVESLREEALKAIQDAATWRARAAFGIKP
jgi:cell division protein FtsB